LFNISFLSHAPRLHAGLIGLPFRPAVFRGLREGAGTYKYAKYDGSGDKQAILIFHLGSPGLRLLARDCR
jgi:hypothetical protein